MITRSHIPCFVSALGAWAICIAAASLAGCKPPPPAAQPPSAGTPAAASNPAAPSGPPSPAAAEKNSASTADDGLPAKVVENLQQLIKLTAEYNARAEKITDRQAYLDQSASLSELESQLSDYVQFMEATEPTLTAAQRATLDREYQSKAKPLIDAKRNHKMRMLGLVQ